MVEGHAAQSTIVAPVPLKEGVDIEALRAVLAGLQEETSDLKQGLEGTGIVHFASLNLVNLGAETRLDARPTHLLAEFNTDGMPRDALARLAQRLRVRLLSPPFRQAGVCHRAECLDCYG